MTATASGFRGFVIVWLGQFASLMGSNITGFALAIYVYRTSGSATTLGVVFALGLLPAVLASPIAGSLVDRWGPRRTLLTSNAGSMLVTIVLAVLLATDVFAIWHVYVLVVITSILGALEVPAFTSLAPQLVSKQHLGRANGMRMLALAASQVLAPVAAGFLLLGIGLYGIVLIDLISFGAAVISLLVVRIPHASPQVGAGTDRTTGLLAEFLDGWRYVVARRGLLALLVFVGTVNFSAGFIELLITPLVLAFSSSGGLGTVLSIGGLGMIITSVAVSIWGGPRRRVRGMFILTLALAAATVLGSLRPNVAMVAVAAFVYMGALGIIISTNQVIWQTKVEPRVMGRVMAILNMVGLVPQLVANVLAGLLVDLVFEPLVGRDEVRSPGLAILIGDGPGRGIALLLLIVGLLIAISVGLAAINPRLRHVEDELPDVAPGTDDELDDEPAVERTVDADPGVAVTRA